MESTKGMELLNNLNRLYRKRERQQKVINLTIQEIKDLQSEIVKHYQYEVDFDQNSS